MEDYRLAKAEALRERDAYASSISNRLTRLKQPEIRGMLMRKAAGELLRTWKPYRQAESILHGHVSGSVVSALGLGLAGLQKDPGRRHLFSGLSMLLGMAIGDDAPSGKSLVARLSTMARNMINGNRVRRDARQAKEE